MGFVHFSGTFDPELRSVLELATDSELYELERILFGPRYFELYNSFCFVNMKLRTRLENRVCFSHFLFSVKK